MAVLAFVLECSAAATFIGWACSLLLWPALAAARRSRLWRAPALRADLAFLLGALPALTSLAVVTAAAAPSVAAALGFAADHCPGHGHHLHLCIVHSTGLRPALGTAGVFALAAFFFRALALVQRARGMRARLTALEALGTAREGRFPIVAVPGAPTLCHAVGLARRRVLISASLEEALSPLELKATLAHEEAHLNRRDPLTGLLLAFAGLFTAPIVARAFLAAWQMASEEAADAEAARAVGDGSCVAGALVRVASLQHRASAAPMATSAFGELALERRVRLLLQDEDRRVYPASALFLAGLTSLAGGTLALAHAASLHHAVETALHRFF